MSLTKSLTAIAGAAITATTLSSEADAQSPTTIVERNAAPEIVSLEAPGDADFIIKFENMAQGDYTTPEGRAIDCDAFAVRGDDYVLSVEALSENFDVRDGTSYDSLGDRGTVTVDPDLVRQFATHTIDAHDRTPADFRLVGETCATHFPPNRAP